MACEIHTGDIGTRFLFTIQDCNSTDPVDVSTASSVEIVFQKTDGSTDTKVGSF